MCFVWITEQTAIISLYSINRLVCITEEVCLLRGTDWVFKCNSGRATALAVTRRPVNVEERVRCGGQSGAGTGFSPVLPFPPVSITHTNAAHSSSSACCCYQKNKRTRPKNLPQSSTSQQAVIIRTTVAESHAVAQLITEFNTMLHWHRAAVWVLSSAFRHYIKRST